MHVIKDLKDIAILVDFDGTITSEDTNDKIVRAYGNKKVMEVNKLYNDGDINLIDLFKRIFNEIRLSEEEYVDFIINNFELSSGFLEFYNFTKSNDIPIAIISGGFDNGIIPLLNKYGINDVDILSNHLVFDGKDITVEFHDKTLECCQYGPCGNCKINHYKSFKKKYKQVIFIGDGPTDQYVANIADTIFAKDMLSEYCISNGIDHILWNDFHDINKILFNI